MDFEQDAYSVGEGATVTVRVQLNVNPERTVTIPITRTNQSGASNSDYSGVPASVTFNSGDTEMSFTFTATQDSVDDDDESVRLGFGTLPEGVTAGTTNVATVSITDDDDPQVTVGFEQDAYSVAEGATVTVRVQLNVNPERTVTVPITRTNQSGASSSDYSGVPASVTFNSGETEMSFTFTATQDSVDDDDERVRLSFGTLPAGVTAGTTDAATVSITDDDEPSSTNQAPTVSAVAAPGRVGGGGTVSLDGTATDPEGDGLTYAWSSDGGGTFADASALDTTWTAPAATQSEQVVNLTLTVTDDGAGFASASATVQVVVEALAPAGVTFTPSALSLTEGGESGSYEVALDDEPTGNVTITITAGGSVTTDPTSLTFTPLNWNTPRTVTVRAAQDADASAEFVTITHTVADGSAPEYLALGALGAVQVSVTDDDQPAVQVSRTQLTVAEGRTATYTVVLVREPSAGVRVSLQPQRVGITGRSVLLNTYSLEFTPTNWNIPQRVTVDAIHDGDGNDDVVPIRHRVATGSAPEYRGLDIDTLYVTVTDPDPGHAAVLTISTRDQDVAEGGLSHNHREHRPRCRLLRGRARAGGVGLRAGTGDRHGPQQPGAPPAGVGFGRHAVAHRVHLRGPEFRRRRHVEELHHLGPRRLGAQPRRLAPHHRRNNRLDNRRSGQGRPHRRLHPRPRERLTQRLRTWNTATPPLPAPSWVTSARSSVFSAAPASRPTSPATSTK